MHASPPYRYTVVVIAERADGTMRTLAVTSEEDELRQRFPASLAPGTLVRHALALAGQEGAASDPLDEVLLSRMRALIVQRLNEPELRVEDLADDLEMSPRHLRRRLQRLTRETPRALLRRMRVERAEMLLRSGAPSVKEVAHAVGYETAEGLRRAFLAVRGAPPSVVRAT